jgi:methylmalonyl-CoA/ethylmalonyl-CoA epimerase
LLGGAWAYGGDSPGFWWGQLCFSTGPKIELLKPSGGPDAAFLERFLAARGPSPHHFNFIVPDIGATLSRVRATGIEPVQVSVDNPTWKEAFLHPKDAFGIVVQVAEQSGPPPVLSPPAELPAQGPATAFALIEHQVADLEAALRLFAGALDGEVAERAESAAAAELAWDNGARLRLVQQAGAATGAVPPHSGALSYLRFTREAVPFTESDRRHAADLAHRLGVPLQLCG